MTSEGRTPSPEKRPSLTAGATEVLSAYLYDWNQDGSERLRGETLVEPGDPAGPPQVGERVVLYGDGLAVVTTVTEVYPARALDAHVIRTEYAHTATVTRGSS